MLKVSRVRQAGRAVLCFYNRATSMSLFSNANSFSLLPIIIIILSKLLNAHSLTNENRTIDDHCSMITVSTGKQGAQTRGTRHITVHLPKHPYISGCIVGYYAN